MPKLPQFPDAAAVYRPALNRWRRYQAGDWAELADLIRDLVRLEKGRLAREWSFQLSAPAVAMTTVRLTGDEQPAALLVVDEERLVYLFTATDDSWQLKAREPLPESGRVIGLNPPLPLVGVSQQAIGIILRPLAEGQPDRQYEALVIGDGLTLRPSAAGADRPHQLLIPRRYGSLSAAGLGRVQSVSPPHSDTVTLYGSDLLGQAGQAAPLTIPFRPLAAIYTADDIFAGGRYETLAAWRWQAGAFRNHPHWSATEIGVDGQVRALTWWARHNATYLLAATDERRLFIIAANGRQAANLPLVHAATALEPDPELSALWLADEAGCLYRLRPVYTPLIDEPLPRAGQLLAEMDAGPLRVVLRDWLQSPEEELAAAAADFTAAALFRDQDWAAPLLAEYAEGDSVRRQPGGAMALVAALEQQALQQPLDHPAVQTVMTQLTAVRQQAHLEVQRRIDCVTGRIAAHAGPIVYEQPAWRALDEARRLSDHAFAGLTQAGAANLAGARRTAAYEAAFAAFAETLLNRRSSIWAFALAHPARALLALPDGTETLVATRAGELWRFDFGAHKPIAPAQRLTPAPAIPRALQLAGPDPAAPDRLLLATVQGDLFVAPMASSEAEALAAIQQLAPELHNIRFVPPDTSEERPARLVVSSGEGRLQLYGRLAPGETWERHEEQLLAADRLPALDLLPQEDARPPLLLAGGALADGRGVLYFLNLADLRPPRPAIHLPAPVLDLKVVRPAGGAAPFIALIAGSGYLYLIEPDGRCLWRYRVGRSARNLAAFDLSANGQPELIVGSEAEGSHVLVLDLDGTARWIIPASAPITHVTATRPAGRQAHVLFTDLARMVHVVEVIPPGSQFEDDVQQWTTESLEQLAENRTTAVDELAAGWLDAAASAAGQGYAAHHFAWRSRRGDKDAARRLLAFDPTGRPPLVQRAYARALVQAAAPPPDDNGLVDQIVDRLSGLLADAAIGSVVASPALRELALPGRLAADHFFTWQPFLVSAAADPRPEIRHAVLQLVAAHGQIGDGQAGHLAWDVLRSALSPITTDESWVREDVARILRDAARSPVALWRLAHLALWELKQPDLIATLGRSQLPLVTSSGLAGALRALAELAQSTGQPKALARLEALAGALADPKLTGLDDIIEPHVAAYRLLALGLEQKGPEAWQQFVAPGSTLPRLYETLKIAEPARDSLLAPLEELCFTAIPRFLSEPRGPETVRELADKLRQTAQQLQANCQQFGGIGLPPLWAGVIGLLHGWTRPEGILADYEEQLSQPVVPQLSVTTADLRGDELLLTCTLHNPSRDLNIEDIKGRVKRPSVQIDRESLVGYSTLERARGRLDLGPQETLPFQMRVPLQNDLRQAINGRRGPATAELIYPLDYYLPNAGRQREDLTRRFTIRRQAPVTLNYTADLPTAWEQVASSLRRALTQPAQMMIHLSCAPFARAGLLEKLDELLPSAQHPRLDAREWFYEHQGLSQRDLRSSEASFLAWLARHVWPDARLELETIRSSGAPTFAFNQLARSRPSPTAVIVDNWDRLLLSAAREPDRHWPPLDGALPTIIRWSREYNVRLLFLGTYLSEHIQARRWALLPDQISVVRLDPLDLSHNRVSGELFRALETQLDGRQLHPVLARFDPPLTAAGIVELCGGHLHCLEMILEALEALAREEPAQPGPAESYLLRYAEATNFFAMLWLWQDIYTRVGLVVTASGEIAIENKNAVQAGQMLARDYYARSPNRQRSATPTLRRDRVLTAVDVNKIASNLYYQSGDVVIRGFIPAASAPTEWGAAGETWLRLLRAGGGADLLQELTNAGLLRRARSRNLGPYFEFAVPLYRQWILHSDIWRQMLEATRPGADYWYPAHLSLDKRHEQSRILFPERRAGPAFHDLQLADAPRIDSQLTPETLPLFLNLYGFRQKPAAEARRRWNAMVRLGDALSRWFQTESTEAETGMASALLEALEQLLDVKPLPRLLDGARFQIEPGSRPAETLAWSYVRLGGPRQILRKELVVAVLRDGDSHVNRVAALRAFLARQLLLLHEREDAGLELALDPQEARQKRLEKRDRSVVFLITAGPAAALRQALRMSGRGAPHLVLLTTDALAELIANEDPTDALLRTTFRQIGRHPFSPYQLTGALSGRSPLFVGRNKELEMILNSLERQDYAILGSRRIGKTSLLRKIDYELRQRSPEVRPAVLYLNMRVNSGENDFYAQVGVALRRQLNRPDLADLLADVPNGHFGDLQEVMQRLRDKHGHPVVILIDEVDPLYINDFNLNDERLFQFLRNNLAQGQQRICTFVMAGFRHIYYKRTSHASVFYNFCDFLNLLSGVNRDAVAHLVELLRQFNVDLDNANEIVGRIARDTYAVPYLVQQACDHLLLRLDQLERDRITPEDAQAVLDRNIQTLIKKELWDDLELDRVIANTGASESKERSRLKTKIVLLATILGLYEHKFEADLAHLALAEEKRRFTAADAVELLRALAGQPWPLDEDAIDRLLQSITMTLALAPDEEQTGVYLFPNDILPDVLSGYYRGVAGKTPNQDALNGALNDLERLVQTLRQTP